MNAREAISGYWQYLVSSDISRWEVAELVSIYPYCQNLRLLLLTRHLEENSSGADISQLLPITATYSIDRPFLYRLVRSFSCESVPEANDPQEDALELSSIEPMAVPAVVEQEPLQQLQIETDPFFDRVISLEDLFEEEEDPGAAETIVDIQYPDLDEAEPVALPVPEAEAIGEELRTDTVPIEKATDFISWLKSKNKGSDGYEYRLAPDYRQLGRPANPTLPEMPARNRDKKGYGLVADIVEKSIAEREDAISETLADILVAQGQKDKAVSMYRRLNLLYPEKSAYFAQKINQILNL